LQFFLLDKAQIDQLLLHNLLLNRVQEESKGRTQEVVLGLLFALNQRLEFIILRVISILQLLDFFTRFPLNGFVFKFLVVIINLHVNRSRDLLSIDVLGLVHLVIRVDVNAFQLSFYLLTGIDDPVPGLVTVTSV
jgi:hypothetical protein